MKHNLLSAVLCAAVVPAAIAQTANPADDPKDCRHNPPATPCYFAPTLTSPGVVQKPGVLQPEVYLGKAQVAPGVYASIFSPLGAVGTTVTPTARKRLGVDITGLYSVQSETFNYAHFVSTGGKVAISHQFTPLIGADLRVSIIGGSFPKFKSIYDDGGDHTYAVDLGPRLEKRVGAFTPYVEGLVGGMYQYGPGMSVGGAAGLKAHVANHLSVVLFDYQYRNGLFQQQTIARVGAMRNNTMKQREELSAGLAMHF